MAFLVLLLFYSLFPILGVLLENSSCKLSPSFFIFCSLAKQGNDTCPFTRTFRANLPITMSKMKVSLSWTDDIGGHFLGCNEPRARGNLELGRASESKPNTCHVIFSDAISTWKDNFIGFFSLFYICYLLLEIASRKQRLCDQIRQDHGLTWLLSYYICRLVGGGVV